MEEIKFESLDYGAYEIGTENRVYKENVRYARAEFNNLYVRSVRLPDGRGNIVYLLTNSFENCIKMINSKYFIVPPTYRRLYYPWILIGKFMSRPYRVNLSKQRPKRNKMIIDQTKLRPYSSKNLMTTSENIFFCAADLYQAIEPIMGRYTIKRNYTTFFSEFKRITDGMTPEKLKLRKEDPSSNNRVLIIDADSFAFNSSDSVEINKRNPLYLLYLAYLRTRDLSRLNVDMDMMICSKNLFLKFNPSKMDAKKLPVFKRALFRIMDTDLDKYTDDAPELSIQPENPMLRNIVANRLEPYTQRSSENIKSLAVQSVEDSITSKALRTFRLDQEIKNARGDNGDVNEDLQLKSFINATPAKTPLTPKQMEVYRTLFGNGYTPLVTQTNLRADDFEDDDDLEEYEDALESDIDDAINSDESINQELFDNIQEDIVPFSNTNTAPVSSARDMKLRKKQAELIVNNSTISEILERESSKVAIQTDDKSAALHTSNKNMGKIRFANFEKTYIEELYTKHILSAFDNLKDLSHPFYITSIDIQDTSNASNLQETWTVKITDEQKKHYTIKVDIPKFYEYRFMWIDNTKWLIIKQNLYNPLVKDSPDTVIMTTNYNKITIERKSTKSLASIERIFSLVKRVGSGNVFVAGDSSSSNMKYISSLEYDELSRRLFKFESNRCTLYFSRDYIKENLNDNIPDDIQGNEFYIGNEGNRPILINEDTGLDRAGRTIIEIIEANLSEDLYAIYSSIKTPSKPMYANCKMAGEWLPVAVVLILWLGLTTMMNELDINWQFMKDAKRIPKGDNTKRYIRFADGILEYENETFAEMILNGLLWIKPEQYTFEQYEDRSALNEFIYSRWGSYRGINEIQNFYEFLIDPITKDVCRDMLLPQTAQGLLVHAVKLLADNKFTYKASDKSYRTRSIEIIPSILYECIATQYKKHIADSRRYPMTLNRRCVIKRLIKEKTVEAYSTLNPVVEVGKMHTISAKGYRGSNSDHSYNDEGKRSYDPSAIGKLAISTSPDKNVGVTKNLVVEPTIGNALGYREQVEDIESLTDVNVFSPVEMLTPASAKYDDAIRTAIAGKQSGHVVPVADAVPALISNGFDEAVQFHLSADFVINAEEDGKVVDVNEELGFVVVQYKSGKYRAISTNPEIVYNSSNAFYLANRLELPHKKIGEKFKKDDVLAYHPNYFRYSPVNGLRYALGPLTKVAFMSSYNTYEDAGICTAQLARRMKTNFVYQETAAFKANANVLSMVKVGDHVNIGDTLVKYDISVMDNELAKFISKLNEENAALLTEETKSDIKSGHAGKIIDIKIYTNQDPENLSPSLQNIVNAYFDKAKARKEYLDSFDNSDGIIKAGYMFTDNTEPTVSTYGDIKGRKGIDVLIEFHIEHSDVMGVGDKIALYAANKQIVSEVIPEGYEPFSEFRPDEEISVLTSPGTIARRMTPSVMTVAAVSKIMLELKRKIKEEIKYK